jgi:hypothetical protein
MSSSEAEYKEEANPIESDDQGDYLIVSIPLYTHSIEI